MQTDNLTKDFSEVRNRFGEYYKQNLRHSYEELEVARKKYMLQLGERFIGLIIAAIILLSFLSRFHEEINKIIIAVYLLTAWFLLYAPFFNYKNDTKDKVMKKILAFWGDFNYSNLVYGEVTEDIINKSGLFTGFTNREYDDYFSGTYKDIKVTVSEQKLSEVHGSGKNRRKITLFDGIFILLDMPKKFSGKTIAHAKGMGMHRFLHNWSGIFSILLLIVMLLCTGAPMFLTDFDTLQRVMNDDPMSVFMSFFSFILVLFIGVLMYLPFFRRKKDAKATETVYLEDIAFGKEWNIEATNQVEARYVLTPVLMESMQAIKKCFYGIKIEFSFFDNKVLIAVHTNKDMFETTSLFTPALDYKKVQEVILQFYSIFAAAELIAGKRK